VEILVTAAMTNEDTRTFEFIFDFVNSVCPQLITDVFVLLVDGDRANGEISLRRFCAIELFI
jgi:hypothetical protein